jgi:hypothetical protein
MIELSLMNYIVHIDQCPKSIWICLVRVPNQPRIDRLPVESGGSDGRKNQPLGGSTPTSG